MVKIKFKAYFISLVFLLVLVLPCYAGIMFQDFEPDNGSTTYGWSIAPYYFYVNFSPPAVPIHVFSGLRSWLVETMSPLYYWPSTGIASQVQTWDFDVDLEKNDRLDFWTYQLPHWGGHNNVGVKFFDNDLYASEGFEVWTTNGTFSHQWSKLTVLFSQLPPDFDLEHINHLQFTTYWPGKYYYDNIAAVRQDRIYQAFEPALRNNPPASEYGWKWNDDDTVGFSGEGEPVYEGSHSWKLVTEHNWSGTGLQSQEQKLIEGEEDWEQSFWHVDLHPEKNDRLLVSVYGLPQNGMDNNLAVQFYDHGDHHTDETKVVAWTKKAATYNNWTRLEVPFSDLALTLNLNDLNKIQLQQYWPGTYYFDDIRASGEIIKIDEESLSQGIVSWDRVEGAGKYILEESRISSNGPWLQVYDGVRNRFNVTRITKLWYRVRWEERNTSGNNVPYISSWSDVAFYVPTPIVMDVERLKDGFLEWNAIPQGDWYEVESALNKEGPWRRIYKGRYPNNPLNATEGHWYRVRGLNVEYKKVILNDLHFQEAIPEGERSKRITHIKKGTVTDVTSWSMPQTYVPGEGFLKTVGTILKDEDGTGSEVILQGVNLGGLFLIEKWMTGIGAGDDPNIEDDFTIRDILTTRFGQEGSDELLTVYQQEYAKAIDFDKLKNMRVNFVRLPIFFRLLQDDEGTYLK